MPIVDDNGNEILRKATVVIDPITYAIRTVGYVPEATVFLDALFLADGAQMIIDSDNPTFIRETQSGARTNNLSASGILTIA